MEMVLYGSVFCLAVALTAILSIKLTVHTLRERERTKQQFDDVSRRFDNVWALCDRLERVITEREDNLFRQMTQSDNETLRLIEQKHADVNATITELARTVEQRTDEMSRLIDEKEQRLYQSIDRIYEDVVRANGTLAKALKTQK